MNKDLNAPEDVEMDLADPELSDEKWQELIAEVQSLLGSSGAQSKLAELLLIVSSTVEALVHGQMSLLNAVANVEMQLLAHRVKLNTLMQSLLDKGILTRDILDSYHQHFTDEEVKKMGITPEQLEEMVRMEQIDTQLQHEDDQDPT